MPIKNREAKKITTLSIDQEDGKKLDIYCKKIDIKKKDFVPLALAYFQKYGIDLSQDESPTEEMTKIRKRLDQFFAFFKKQEQEYIMPLLLELQHTQKGIVAVHKQGEATQNISKDIHHLSKEARNRADNNGENIVEAKSEILERLALIQEQTSKKKLF